MIPEQVRTALEGLFSAEYGEPHFVVNHRPVSGGCIHHAHWVKINEKECFVKFNRAEALENFQREQRGLELLLCTHTLKVPRVLFSGKQEGYAYLVLQFIESTPKHEDFWEWFGQGLAALHRHTRPAFGLDHDNYIGTLEQSNEDRDTWLRFFIEVRLEKQLALAEQNGYAPAGLSGRRISSARRRRTIEAIPGLLRVHWRPA